MDPCTPFLSYRTFARYIGRGLPLSSPCSFWLIVDAALGVGREDKGAAARMEPASVSQRREKSIPTGVIVKVIARADQILKFVADRSNNG